MSLARMHGRSKGKSGSKKPASKQPADWVEYKPKEVSDLIAGMANAGKTASEIGAILRDQHGIPSVKALMGKRISQILEEHKLMPAIPTDLMNLIRSSVKLQKHIGEHKKDYSAKRGYDLTVSKIRRLAEYYTKKGRLPKEWRYSAETAELLVK